MLSIKTEDFYCLHCLNFKINAFEIDIFLQFLLKGLLKS